VRLAANAEARTMVMPIVNARLRGERCVLCALGHAGMWRQFAGMTRLWLGLVGAVAAAQRRSGAVSAPRRCLLTGRWVGVRWAGRAGTPGICDFFLD
jgi:hypothetical protein